MTNLEEIACLKQKIEELERRLLTAGGLPCAGCGGPHDFDTSVPSVMWNAVIRAKGLPEYLCTTCIVREFVRANLGFTATLWNEEFYGVPIELIVNGQNAKDAEALTEENNSYRVRLAEADAVVSKLHDLLFEEPFDRQAANAVVWQIHALLRP